MDSLDRKLSIKSLFDSYGYKLFKDELDALILATDIERENAFKNPCTESTTNFLNGHKHGLKAVTYILDGFKEELEQTDEQIAEGR